MKPETRKRLWLIASLASLWLSSLFLYQTIVADPRYNLNTVMNLEFLVCAFAVIFAIAALVLHTRQSTAGLVFSLVLLCTGMACLLNTQLATLCIYKDWSPPDVTVNVDQVGPVEVGFGDVNSDREFFATVKMNDQRAVGTVKDVRIYARYNDLLGRMISSRAEHYVADPDKGEWGLRLPPCFSGKELTATILITTADGKVHEGNLTVKVPKKPIWSK